MIIMILDPKKGSKFTPSYSVQSIKEEIEDCEDIQVELVHAQREDLKDGLCVSITDIDKCVALIWNNYAYAIYGFVCKDAMEEKVAKSIVAELDAEDSIKIVTCEADESLFYTDEGTDFVDNTYGTYKFDDESEYDDSEDDDFDFDGESYDPTADDDESEDSEEFDTLLRNAQATLEGIDDSEQGDQSNNEGSVSSEEDTDASEDDSLTTEPGVEMVDDLLGDDEGENNESSVEPQSSDETDSENESSDTETEESINTDNSEEVIPFESEAPKNYEGTSGIADSEKDSEEVISCEPDNFENKADTSSDKNNDEQVETIIEDETNLDIEDIYFNSEVKEKDETTEVQVCISPNGKQVKTTKIRSTVKLNDGRVIQTLKVRRVTK